MVSSSAMITLALIVCSATAAPLRGQKSIQKKHSRMKRAVGSVGAEVKTAGKIPVAFSSNTAPKATVSYMSDEPAIGDDERPNIESKIAYTPREPANEEGSILPSFNLVLFGIAVVALVRLQLELQKQRRDTSEGSDELLESSKLDKGGEANDWVARARQEVLEAYVQEAMTMINQSMDFASSAATQACIAADRFAKKTQKPKTDANCDFGLPEDPQSTLDTRTIQDADFYQEPSQETSECPQSPVDLIGMAPEEAQDESHLMDSMGLIDTDKNADDLVGL